MGKFRWSVCHNTCFLFLKVIMPFQKANLKRLHRVWFHLWNILEMPQLQRGKWVIGCWGLQPGWGGAGAQGTRAGGLCGWVCWWWHECGKTEKKHTHTHTRVRVKTGEISRWCYNQLARSGIVWRACESLSLCDLGNGYTGSSCTFFNFLLNL